MSTHPLTADPVLPRSGPEPEAPRLDYAGVTRGPGQRWWRLPVTLLLFIILWSFFSVLLTISFTAAGLATDGSWDWWLDELTTDLLGPTGILFNNLFLAALIPTTVLSTWIGQRTGIGFIHSVTGRWRWGWFGQVSLILLPVWSLYVGIGIVLDLPNAMTPHNQLATMLIIVWLTTPLQCAGEEYAFRGWLTQNIGGLFGNRIVAWVVPTTLSAILFSVAHGSLDPWILTDLVIFAVALSIITWRTGGIEAAVALHMINNLLIMNFTLVVGGFDESIIDADTAGTPVSVLLSLVAQTLAVALVWWWAKRRGVQRYTSQPTRRGTYQPTVPPDPRPLHPVAAWQPLSSLDPGPHPGPPAPDPGRDESAPSAEPSHEEHRARPDGPATN